MLGGIIAALILIFDFVISVWDAYASGYNIGILRKADKGSFSLVASYAGLGLGFVGITYVMIIVISLLAYAVGYVGPGVVEYAMAFNFLVFGLLIIGFGTVITIQSIMVAAKRRNFMSIFLAIYNTIALVWDIAIYAEGFRSAVGILKGDRNDRGNAMIIVLAAVLVAFFITHAAYKRGLKKAEMKA
ncbi:MAG: hypothetical protein ACP5RM_02995 [Candidatus Micrarchaeia archaeon]